MAETTTKDKLNLVPQEAGFLNGNEMVAEAGKAIDYHMMGYFPITPSTQIAEELDAMKAEGLHDIKMVAADGEHSAAGICMGAAIGGGRILNATSAQGLLFALEQLPSQAGLRFPMVLNVVCRAINSPLNILGDHSDIMFALNTGWIILMARDPQMVYDMNFVAVKIGELQDVRLPVIVASDGFFTSHQKRKVNLFKKSDVLRDWLGGYDAPYSALDPANPITIGPYMNDPDLINNKKQQAMAMEAAYRHLPEVLEEFSALSGRSYPMVETYRMEDAEAALFILNTAYDTTRDAVDRLRDKGLKVGVVATNVLRPFPVKEIQEVLKNVKALCVADRQDSYGARGGNMSLEVKAALKDDPHNRTLVFSRIYGLGGKQFYIEEAEELLNQAMKVSLEGKVDVGYDYLGAEPGNPDYVMERVMKPFTEEELDNGLNVEINPETGKVDVKGVNLRKLTAMPKRIAPGHGACPGCGIFPSLNLFLKGIKGYVVVLFHTGCGEIVTSGFPYSAHRMTFVHNLFQNGAATLSGLVEMYHQRKKRGEIPRDMDITFVMISGDGGLDIGMGSLVGAALRNHPMIILEYDNQGYMNTGDQLSQTTPLGHSTSTSHVGGHQAGKLYHHRDTAQILAATHIPYIFTGAESHPQDLIRKGAKAWHYSREGTVFGRVLSACPLGWRSDDATGTKVVETAVNSCFFPLYEVEKGITTVTFDPQEKNKKVPISEWLKLMGKTRHLVRPEYSEFLERSQKEVERRWDRLKAMHDNPLL
jgi:pyruvate ferredoxin oxidoreductase alpha subunit